VVTSLIMTKHRAVYVEQYFGEGSSCVKTVRKKMLFYDLRQYHVDGLRYHLGVYDWSSIMSCNNVL
jgi:hypothetical protein